MTKKYQKVLLFFIRFGFPFADLFSQIPKYGNLGICTKTASERIEKLIKERSKILQAIHCPQFP
jgi:hypothetical protein